jgi:RNA polymerase sigma factor for flagellar operon FliA
MYTATGTIERSSNIQQFAPLVRKIAHHMQSKLPASVEVDDLIQAGMLGLMDALSRFEDGQGAQFETYASQRIRGAMLDELRQNDWLPRGVRKTQRQIETALGRLEQRFGRAASETEIAAELGVSLEQYQALLADAKGGQLLYYQDYDGDGETSEPFLDRHCADHAADPLARDRRASRARKDADGPVLRAGTQFPRNRRGARRHRIARLPAAQPGRGAAARAPQELVIDVRLARFA